MFGRRKPKSLAPDSETDLKLGAEDRTTIRMTKSSDQLAREMLEIAREAAKDLPAGREVTVEVTQEHPEIHHMELMFSFMMLAHEYGLQAGVQSNNSQTFRKV